jgi:CheY-like chemotaxis protein
MSKISAEFAVVPRVLVVDDDPGFLKVVAQALVSAGLQVETASSGSGALERVRSKDSFFDLVITDH